MARYKPTNYAQGQFISIAFEHQILPGTFEHALNYIVDNKSRFERLDAARSNDDGGAPAYDPRVMLKIVLFAYSRGIVSSREIEAACDQNVVMMALYSVAADGDMKVRVTRGRAALDSTGRGRCNASQTGRPLYLPLSRARRSVPPGTLLPSPAETPPCPLAKVRRS